MKTTKAPERRHETSQPHQPSTRTTRRVTTRRLEHNNNNNSSSRRGRCVTSGSSGRSTESRRTRSTSSHTQLVDKQLSAAARRTGSEPRQDKCSVVNEESKRSSRKSVRRNVTSELNDAGETAKKTKRDIAKQSEHVVETLPSEPTAATTKKMESEDDEMQQTPVKSEFSVELRPKRRRRYNLELLSRSLRPSARSSTNNAALKHDTQLCDDEQQQCSVAAAAAEKATGDVILLVSCGDNAGRMALNKLDIGSRGSCIEVNGSWLTPNEFQLASGRTNTKDWKRSIRHHGKSLKFLVDEGLLSLYSPPVCICEYCDLQSATKDAQTSGEATASSPVDPGAHHNADVTRVDDPEVGKRTSQKVARSKQKRSSEPSQRRSAADETTTIRRNRVADSCADIKTETGNGKGSDADQEMKTKRRKKERTSVEKKKNSDEEKEKRADNQKRKEIQTKQRRNKELHAADDCVDGKGKDASENVDNTAGSVQQRSLTILNVPQFLQTTSSEVEANIDGQLDTTRLISADNSPVADIMISQQTGDSVDTTGTLPTAPSADNKSDTLSARDVILSSLTPTSRDAKPVIGSSNKSTCKSKTTQPTTTVAGVSTLPGVPASPGVTKPTKPASSSCASNQSSSPRSNYGLYPPALYQVYPPYIVMGIPVQPFAYTQQQTPTSGDKYLASPDKPKVASRSTAVGKKVRDNQDATSRTKRRPRRKQDGDVSSTTPDCSLHATVSGLMTSSANNTDTKQQESAAGIQTDVLPSASRESDQMSGFVYDIYGALDLTVKK